MRQRRGNLARATIVAASSQSKQRVDATLKLAKNLRADSDRQARLEACLCKACHYFSRLGGAAMTNRECAGCGKDELYSSTSTDTLCLDCAVKHSLCKRCGGDLMMRTRRNTWPDINETLSNRSDGA